MTDDIEEFLSIVNTDCTPITDVPETETITPSGSGSGPNGDTRIDATMWAVHGEGRDFFPTESTSKQLTPGQYTVKWSDTHGPYFSKRDINLDDLLILPDSSSERIIKHIKEFWGKEQTFRDFGYLWKRGVMLYGPPGSGKTSTVQQLSKQLVEMGGVTIYCVNPDILAKGLEILRRLESDRPIVVIFEDIDAIVQQYGESDVLAILDGELQVDNVVFVATTNYPEKLDRRMTNRPSRFDEIIKIGMPSNNARATYLKAKNPKLSNESIEQWVALSEGFSIAHLKELIISVECFGKTVDDASTRLHKMIGKKPDDYEETISGKFGFIK